VEVDGKMTEWLSEGEKPLSFFPSFSPLASVPNSFPTSCSLNGRTAATKAKLHLASLLVSSALLAVEFQRSKVPLGCLSRLDPLGSSSNIKYSLVGEEKDPNPRATQRLAEHSRALE